MILFLLLILFDGFDVDVNDFVGEVFDDFFIMLLTLLMLVIVMRPLLHPFSIPWSKRMPALDEQKPLVLKSEKEDI